MEKIEKEKIITRLRPAGFALLVVIIGLIVYIFQKGPEKKVEEEKERALHTLTDEEKKEILQSLSAPEGAKSQYTDKEKRQILQDLSAQKDSSSALSEDEKKALLESLSVPQK